MNSKNKAMQNNTEIEQILSTLDEMSRWQTQLISKMRELLTKPDKTQKPK